MFTSARHESLAAAKVLALLVAANGRVDMAEIDRLQALQSFARLGVDRDSFVVVRVERLADGGDRVDPHSDENFVDLLVHENDAVEELGELRLFLIGQF